MKNVVFVDGVRTAFGRQGGTLRDFYPTDLAALAVKGLVEKTGITERAKVDDVLMGCALHDAHTNLFAHYISLKAGLPYGTSATFVEQQCGSAIACMNYAAWKIMCGASDIVIAGGAESHSQRFVKFSTSVQPYKNIAPAAIPNMLAATKEDSIPMLEISDRMAAKWGVSREECDEFAYASQARAAAAVEKGYFDEEIVPVIIPGTKKTPEVRFDKDEHLRPGTTMEALAKLRPVNADGVSTAGNSSGLNDGAGAVLMMSEETAEKLGYEPIARFVMGADIGVDPKEMGIGPAFSNAKIMRAMGLGLNDIDVFEVNEAFAAQNLACIREMEAQFGGKINRENWNPNGGAIAFGHPNGASGVRIALAAMKELKRRGGKYAMFSSCCGGGLGVSTLIERIG